MVTTDLFYRWEHTPKCKMAQRELNKASNDLNRESRRLTKVEKDTKKDKVQIGNLRRSFIEKATLHAEKARKLLSAHEECDLVPRWSTPPKKQETK